MPTSPLTRLRAHKQIAYLFPKRRLALKELPSGECVVWLDNNPQASFAGKTWEEVMQEAVKETWKEKE